MALVLERALALELLAEASKMMLLGDQLAPELHDGLLELEVLDDSPALELLLLFELRTGTKMSGVILFGGDMAGKIGRSSELPGGEIALTRGFRADL